MGLIFQQVSIKSPAKNKSVFTENLSRLMSKKANSSINALTEEDGGLLTVRSTTGLSRESINIAVNSNVTNLTLNKFNTVKTYIILNKNTYTTTHFFSKRNAVHFVIW